MVRSANDPHDLLATPGGQSRLRRQGGDFVSADGRRYSVQLGVVRMLREVDPDLAAELQAQEAARDIYLDDHLLLSRYEQDVARLCVEQMLGAALEEGRRAEGPPRVLDCGCGIGLVGRLFPDLGLYGLDVSFPLLEQVGPGYHLLVEGSAERLPFRDGGLDVVLALNMLHHVVHPDRAVAELARVLRPGGLLITIDPRKVAPIELAKWFLRRNDPAYAPTHKAFGVGEYESLFTAGGRFRIEETRRLGLFSLIGMGGFDALGLSRHLPAPDDVIRLLLRLDAFARSLPGGDRVGLNLVVRARRS